MTASEAKTADVRNQGVPTMRYVTNRKLRAVPQTLGLRRRLCLTAILVAGATSFASEGVLAQSDFPNRPMNLLVPYPAGSASDTWREPSSVRFGTKSGSRSS